MQVNATQALRSALGSSGPTREQAESAASFQAMLVAAQRNMAQDAPASDQAGLASGSAGVSAVSGKTGADPLVAKTAAQQLAEYASKSVAERIRDAVLKDMGLTEEDLDAMPPDERAAIEEEIADRVKQKLMGLAGDATPNPAPAQTLAPASTGSAAEGLASLLA